MNGGEAVGHAPAELWAFLPWGYLLTVALELPVLWYGLSPRHTRRQRWAAACWLTACTYPIVVLVLPLTVEVWWGRTAYVVVAEVFAPLAECALFLATERVRVDAVTEPLPTSFWNRHGRDLSAIVAANLVSFLLGGWLVEQLARVFPG